ncbi:MAG: exodeoxyribonuclease VII large subunit [Faecalimonas sp.]|nr:exodeoxyribonuclease VII large subunit [Faecalimonas sp.]
MRNVYSVKQVNAYIKNMFTQDFMLNRIYIKGEVSNCKYHTSGHIYFSLKDESGSIACIMFAGQRSGLAFKMQDGQQVIVLGSVTTYERDGKYQLYAKEIILDGAGLLYEKFEALKRELGEMGMFAPEYKQPIPKFAKKIGIVTAPTGAAIRDIMNISARRNPYVQLILYPALVQGDGAAASIVKGIEMLDKHGVDVIIVGRGGGSIEDLWAFNEEPVASAIFNCRTPIISAVGHETDTTIADYVADMRAPTPSAAAELAVFEYQALENYMEEMHLKLKKALFQKLQIERMKLERYRLKMNYLHPKMKLREKQQRSVEIEQKLRNIMEKKLNLAKQRLAIQIERMKGASPLAKLNQGFSYVASENGNVVKSIEQVQPKDRLTIYMTDGIVKAKVEDTMKEDYSDRANIGNSI